MALILQVYVFKFIFLFLLSTFYYGIYSRSITTLARNALINYTLSFVFVRSCYLRYTMCTV
jgi:hypothetical protein